MNKTAAVAAVFLIALGAFVTGRYTGKPGSRSEHPGTRRVLYYVDSMHPSYRSDKPGIAPDCGMPLEPVYEGDDSTAKLQLPAGAVSVSQEKQQLIGVRVETVQKNSGSGLIRTTGRVVVEDTRVYRINSGMEGFIRETFNDSVGVMVKKDQKLATFYGPDSLSVASGFLAATERVPGATGKDGSRTVPFPGAVSKQGVSSLQGYTDRLRNLGMSDVQIKQMAESGRIPESIDIVAPVDGFILARNITPRQHFDHATEFYRIADLSRVWILADIFGSDAQNIRPGAIARVTLSGRGKTMTARVSDVLPEVDPATRTLKLRLEADNPGLELRPEMFVDVEFKGKAAKGLTVPQEAVLDSGRQKIVYVETSEDVFEPRAVELGNAQGDRVTVLRGLEEGDRIVTSGNFLVDSYRRAVQ